MNKTYVKGLTIVYVGSMTHSGILGFCQVRDRDLV